MSTVPHIPEGFCPNCGYAIDPGRCSECGREVAPEQLVRVEDKLKRKKRIRRFVGIGVVAALLIAGYQIYTRIGGWPRLVPTSFLLELQSRRTQQPSDADQEILRRIVAGVVSEADVRRVVDRGIIITQSIDLLARSPSQRPFRVRFKIEKTALMQQLSGNWSGCLFMVSDVVVKIDDRIVDRVIGLTTGGEIHQLESLYEGMADGPHKITVAAKVKMRTKANDWSDFRRLEMEATTVCEPKPCSEFCKPVWTPDLASVVRETAALTVSTSSRPMLEIRVDCSSDQVALVGRVELRDDDQSDWQGFTSDGPPISLRSDAGRGALGYFRSFPISDELNRRIRESGKCDFRFVPDACCACELGISDYFNGVVEWIGVPIVKKDSGKGTSHLPSDVLRY